VLHGAAPYSTFVNLRLVTMPSKHRITVSLSAEERDALALLSVKNRVSQAWIARLALVEFLERHQDDQMQLPFASAGPLQDDSGRASTEALSGPPIRGRTR